MKHSRSSQPKRLSLSVTHATPPKAYRINEQDVYNNVRNNVHETFKGTTSRDYQLLKEYVNGTEIQDPKREGKMNFLCKKYSILKNKRGKGFFEGVNVNVQEIASRYVRSKSKDKQKQQERKRLKRDIRTNYRYGTKPQYLESQSFFSIQRKQLSRLEQNSKIAKKQRPSSQKNISSKHPYIELYEEAQKEAFENFKTKKSLQIDIDYPNLPELQEWEKNTQNLKRVFEGPPNRRRKTRRQIQSARERPSSKEVSFYLT